MLIPKNERKPFRTESKLLSGEIALCSFAIALAVGMFAISNTEKEGPFVVACDSILLSISTPSTASMVGFHESVCQHPASINLDSSITEKSVTHPALVVMTTLSSSDAKIER